jgi:hypothetical protein
MIQKVFDYVEHNPNSSNFFARQTRVSLTDAVLRPFEKDVLPPNHPMKPALRGAKPENRKVYYHPNGSFIKCLGIEDQQGGDEDDFAGHFKSTQYNMGLIEEITESSMPEIETIIVRMREKRKPGSFNQVIGLFNPPNDPDHWIWTFKGRPGVTFYETVLEDNPHYFEYKREGSKTHPLTGKNGEWTEDGLDYLRKLEITSGDIRRRYVNGVSGMDIKRVHPEYSAQVHVPDVSFLDWLRNNHLITDKRLYIEQNFDVAVSIDWGVAHPTVFGLIFAAKSDSFVWFDGKKARHRLVAQLYRTRQVADDLGKEFLGFCGYQVNEDKSISEIDNDLGFRIPIFDKQLSQAVPVYTDHDLQARTLFEREVSLHCTPAYKNVDTGLKEVSRELREENVLFDKFMIGEKDYVQSQKYYPTCIQEEFSRYRWRKDNKGVGKVPNRVHDDGCTMFRYYLAMYLGIKESEESTAQVKRSGYADTSPKYKVREVETKVEQSLLSGWAGGGSLIGTRGGSII